MIDPQIVDIINWKCVCTKLKARRKKAYLLVAFLLYIFIQNRKTKWESLSECSCQKLNKIEYFCSIHNYFQKPEQEMQVSTHHSSLEWALRFWIGFVVSKLKNVHAALAIPSSDISLGITTHIISRQLHFFSEGYTLWHFYMIALSRLFSTLIDNLVYRTISLVLRGL